MPCERAKRTASDSEMENENCKKQQNMKLRNLIKQIKIINPALDDDLPTVHPLCTSIRSPAYYFPTVGIRLKLSHPCVFHRYTSNHIPCFPVHFTFQVDARFEWHIFCNETMKSYTMDSNGTSCSRADCAFIESADNDSPSTCPCSEFREHCFSLHCNFQAVEFRATKITIRHSTAFTVSINKYTQSHRVRRFSVSC